METVEIPDQGHVPLLDNADLIRRVTEFVARCDDAREMEAGTDRNSADLPNHIRP